MKKEEEKKMNKKAWKKEYRDGRGNTVPARYVGEVEKVRDSVVDKLFALAEREEDRLKTFKEVVFAEFDEYLQYLSTVNGVKNEDWKGNVRLTSFDGTKSIEIKIKEYIDFDERISQAKAIIDELVKEWSAGTRAEILMLIQRAFRLDRAGNRNVNEILALRELKINDPKWAKAMNLLDDARKVVKSKSYIKIQRRKGPEGVWETLQLDLAAVRVDE